MSQRRGDSSKSHRHAHGRYPEARDGRPRPDIPRPPERHVDAAVLERDWSSGFVGHDFEAVVNRRSSFSGRIRRGTFRSSRFTTKRRRLTKRINREEPNIAKTDAKIRPSPSARPSRRRDQWPSHSPSSGRQKGFTSGLVTRLFRASAWSGAESGNARFGIDHVQGAHDLAVLGGRHLRLASFTHCQGKVTNIAQVPIATDGHGVG